MVFRFVLKVRNDFEYMGQLSRFVHLFGDDADAIVVAVAEGHLHIRFESKCKQFAIVVGIIIVFALATNSAFAISEDYRK